MEGASEALAFLLFIGTGPQWSARVCRGRSGPAGPGERLEPRPCRAAPAGAACQKQYGDRSGCLKSLCLQSVTEESPTSETHSAFGAGHLSSFVTDSLLSLSTVESVFYTKTLFCVRCSSWSGGPREPSGTPSVCGVLAGVGGTCVWLASLPRRLGWGASWHPLHKDCRHWRDTGSAQCSPAELGTS